MKRSRRSTILAMTASACFLVHCVTGCATIAPAAGDGAGQRLSADQASPDQLAPPCPRTAEQPWSAGRRAFEIPAGFVRGPAAGDVFSKRSALEFAYVPRSISCAEAWKVAVTVGEESSLDPALLFGIMRVESSFKVNVISYAGAIGLMQVMPGPAARLGCGDLLDPVENARCGALILSRFLRRFDNRLILGLSAYNAGFGMPGKAKKNSTVPANFNYPENVLRVRAKFLRWGCAPWD